MEKPTVSIYGIPVLKLNMADTMELLAQAVESKRPHQVITANPIMIMTALERQDYMEVMRSAEFVVPDGAGLVWAASYIGRPVAGRVAGFDLMHELLRLGQTRGWRVFLLGTSPGIIGKAAHNLQAKFPGCRIVGCRDGYFGEREDAEVIREIRESKPDLLFVGRSAETQDPWIARYKEELGVPVMMGIGGSFDIVAGHLKRAPLWMQQMRLEWLYRLLQEPARYKRMLVLPKFALKVIREKEKLKKA